MTPNEQALEQILQAYDNNEIDFSRVPAFDKIVRAETERRVLELINLDQMNAQAQATLHQDRDNYRDQVNRILQEQAKRA